MKSISSHRNHIQTKSRKNPLDSLRNEQGAIDLASIMVGVIVIGLIGGVIAATVFAVIPWAQDAAAKQQLDNIVTAENAYMGFSSVSPSLLPSTARPNTYGYSNELEAANVLIQGKTYCVIATPDGKGYNAYAQSGSGKVWTASEKKTQPELYPDALPSACAFIADGFPTPPPPPYVNPTPKLTKLTYQCPTARTGAIPMNGSLTGTETWSDGVTVTYTGAADPTSRTLLAGVTYTVTFDGTYKFFNSGDLQTCVRSLDHWGMSTGAISGMSAFYGASLLTSVPEHIPSTVTGVEGMFSGATIFNDPNISKWDMSNVRSTFQMFTNAKAFNQPLNNWNMSQVDNPGWMFYGASAFNQPLNKWNMSKATNMMYMFNGATAFNQDINSWDVSKVTAMNGMFFNAKAFNKPLNNWNVGAVTGFNGMFTNSESFNQPLDNWNTSNGKAMQGMFNGAISFNQNIDSWNTGNVTNMSSVFKDATSFNQPLNNWNISKVWTMSYMFSGATAFNQPLNKWVHTSATDLQFVFQNATAFNQNINSWNVSSVDTMNYMFSGATAFNQPLNSWNTVSLTNLSEMFSGATSFNQDISSWNTSNVTRMTSMFDGATAFNKPLNSWNTSKVSQMAFMFRDATSFNQPLNNWDVTKVTNIGPMFRNATAFYQDLSSWNLASLTTVTTASYFIYSGFPTAYLPPKITL